jgi:hypothetical protein
MVVSLLLYIKGGAWRDAHTLPLLLGALCKPTILIFPLVLAVYQSAHVETIHISTMAQPGRLLSILKTSIGVVTTFCERLDLTGASEASIMEI